MRGKASAAAEGEVGGHPNNIGLARVLRDRRKDSSPMAYIRPIYYSAITVRSYRIEHSVVFNQMHANTRFGRTARNFFEHERKRSSWKFQSFRDYLCRFDSSKGKERDAKFIKNWETWSRVIRHFSAIRATRERSVQSCWKTFLAYFSEWYNFQFESRTNRISYLPTRFENDWFTIIGKIIVVVVK